MVSIQAITILNGWVRGCVKSLQQRRTFRGTQFPTAGSPRYALRKRSVKPFPKSARLSHSRHSMAILDWIRHPCGLKKIRNPDCGQLFVPSNLDWVEALRLVKSTTPARSSHHTSTSRTCGVAYQKGRKATSWTIHGAQSSPWFSVYRLGWRIRTGTRREEY